MFLILKKVREIYKYIYHKNTYYKNVYLFCLKKDPRKAKAKVR